MTTIQKLRLLFWGAIAISSIPLAVNTVEYSFGGAVKVEAWLTSLIFLGFGYGISAIQNAFKISSQIGDKQYRLYLLISIVLVLVILLPLAATKAVANPDILTIRHFIAIGLINLLLLNCAYIVDVTYSAIATTPGSS